MKNKSCELDTICTSVFKQLLPVHIDKISQIGNLSLTSGYFCMKWKTALLRTLLKRHDQSLSIKSTFQFFKPVLYIQTGRAMYDQATTGPL